jgi:hypothetical protein
MPGVGRRCDTYSNIREVQCPQKSYLN